MNLAHFQIHEQACLRDALKKINDNQQGIVFITNAENQVIGLVTDGDIRRNLITHNSLEKCIGDCANRHFVWADEQASRELLLKQLDNRIRVIPLLNAQRQLINIVTRQYLPIMDEKKVYARARAPVRVSFSGGGSDLTHYFLRDEGAVINSTVAIYSHATLRTRDDGRVIVQSRDLQDRLEAESLEQAFSQQGKFDLVLALLRVIQPQFGFELFLHSDFPMQSGLGGSAVISAAILGCFNQFRQDKWTLHELAELAYQAERLYLGVAGGWQDQYASVFGGFNFMEFRMEQNIVHPLRVNRDILLELEECLVLCDSNQTHDSGAIHQDQRQQMSKADIQDKVKQNVELTYRMRNYLLRGQLDQFGQCLNEAWRLKRQFSDKIANADIDAIYDFAMQKGALGGKLLGAGGGGFLLFYVPAFRKLALMAALDARGHHLIPLKFESEGLKSWIVREQNAVV